MKICASLLKFNGAGHNAKLASNVDFCSRSLVVGDDENQKQNCNKNTNDVPRVQPNYTLSHYFCADSISTEMRYSTAGCCAALANKITARGTAVQVGTLLRSFIRRGV